MYRVATVVALLWAGSLAACPDRPPMKDLDLQQFAGRWYGILGPVKFEDSYKCGFQDFSPRGAGIVNWKVQFYNVTTNAWHLLHGEMGQIKRSGEFEGFRAGFRGGVKFVILATDYYRWAVFWQCHESNDVEYAFLLSREQTLHPQLQEETVKLLPSDTIYTPIDQSHCDEFAVLPVWLPHAHNKG